MQHDFIQGDLAPDVSYVLGNATGREISAQGSGGLESLKRNPKCMMHAMHARTRLHSVDTSSTHSRMFQEYLGPINSP